MDKRPFKDVWKQTLLLLVIGSLLFATLVGGIPVLTGEFAWDLFFTAFAICFVGMSIWFMVDDFVGKRK